MDNAFNKALRESLNYGRCFPNTIKWAMIEYILIDSIHSILASIKLESYTPDLVTAKFNEAADKVTALIKLQ